MYTKAVPANATHRSNGGPMLAHRLQRWTNVGPPLDRCVVLAGVPFSRLVNPLSAGTHFRRQNLTSVGVRLCHLKSIPALGQLRYL